jgi:hypothetical protein
MDTQTLTTTELTTIIYAAAMDDDVSEFISEISLRANGGNAVAQNFMQRYRGEI